MGPASSAHGVVQASRLRCDWDWEGADDELDRSGCHFSDPSEGDVHHDSSTKGHDARRR